MDSRVPEPEPNDLWNQTDKKTAKSFLWKPVKQEQKIKMVADDILKNAAEAAFLTLPVITAGGVQMMCGSGGDYMEIFKILAVPYTIGGVVLDTIKAPFCLAAATVEGIAGGLAKLASLLFDKSPSQQAIDQIFTSFLIRMRETATILVALGLEDANVLDEKLRSGDIEELVGLTLLHTAFVSRHKSCLLLASEKKLHREDCPSEGWALFDAISALRDSIKKAMELSDNYDPCRRDNERDIAESRVACNWIRLIKAGKTLTAFDRPDATDAQLAIANDIIAKIASLKKMGMKKLPESPGSVVRHMPGKK